MTECNYLYLVALFSFWLSLVFWGLLMMGAIVGSFGVPVCRALWEMVGHWIGADGCPERRGYLSALRDIILYVVSPVVIVLAGFLVYWECHSEARPHVGLVEGRSGGERVSVQGVGLRWVPDGEAPCWMMEREVCLGLWRTVSHDRRDFPAAYERHPVSFSRSFAIKEFVRNMERQLPVRGWTWRVPTERQWRTACCAGATEPSPAEKIRQGWLRENGEDHAHATGERPPNDWGFLDIVGNVAEVCRDEVGLILNGGDYAMPAAASLLTGFCSIDKNDGFLWTTRNDEDGIVEDVGLRLCLEPNPIAKAYVGSTFVIRQTPTVVAYGNFVLVYGLINLFLMFFLPWAAPLFPQPLRKWMENFSVFDEWRELMTGDALSRVKKLLVMVVKYVIDWVIGLVIVSPLTLIIPGLPDPEFSIPEAALVIVAGAAVGPFVLTGFAAWRMFRSVLSDMRGLTAGQKARMCYVCGFLPLALLFSWMAFHDYARPYWRELTGKDACAVDVATPVVQSGD